MRTRSGSWITALRSSSWNRPIFSQESIRSRRSAGPMDDFEARVVAAVYNHLAAHSDLDYSGEDHAHRPPPRTDTRHLGPDRRAGPGDLRGNPRSRGLDSLVLIDEFRWLSRLPHRNGSTSLEPMTSGTSSIGRLRAWRRGVSSGCRPRRSTALVACALRPDAVARVRALEGRSGLAAADLAPERP